MKRFILLSKLLAGSLLLLSFGSAAANNAADTVVSNHLTSSVALGAQSLSDKQAHFQIEVQAIGSAPMFVATATSAGQLSASPGPGSGYCAKMLYSCTRGDQVACVLYDRFCDTTP
jgi:hypothetical protein